MQLLHVSQICFSSRSDPSIRIAPIVSLEFHHSLEVEVPENATTLEKEKAILDAKRCKIQRDVKKSVDKAIYDNFRGLSNNQIYIELRDGFTLFDRSSPDKDLADQKCLTTGEKVVSFASSILAFGTWLPSCLVTQQVRKTFSCCKEYTSYYRRLATKTVSIQQEELQEH